MDILIECVHTYAKDTITFPLPHGRFGYAKDTNFADDLLSYTRTLEVLQDKADIYSAALAIVRLKFAANKFQCFQLGPHPKEDL